jgi:hypothetical protein
MLAAPRPRSEAQREAARANGARSRGPTSAEGKARSSMNAFRHGLCSPAILAPDEDPEAFAALLAALRAEHRPTDVTDELLVERLAVALWKLDRCDRLEAQLAACPPRPPAGRIYPDGTPVLLTRSTELATLSAHAARLERTVHRLLAALAARPARARAEMPVSEATVREVRARGATVAEVVAPEAALREPRSPAPAVEPGPSPAATENRGNEPEPVTAEAAASGGPLGEAAGRAGAATTREEAGAAAHADRISDRRNEPGPPSTTGGPPPGKPAEPAAATERVTADRETVLANAARRDPDLALTIAERLAREGELARLHRFFRGEGREIARALFRDRPRPAPA